MANSYFQFKQFTVQQDSCAMKVTTDGCLFGSIVAIEISRTQAQTILDIGTGTGLLSLMVAQQNRTASIDAVEIDAAAAKQATENVAASPWKEKITILQGDILNYKPTIPYDVVISNPPFYEQQLSSPNKKRELAHHSSELTLHQLFQQVKQLLQEKGKCYVLLPFYRLEEAISLAKSKQLFPAKQWLIQQTPKHSFFRAIVCFSSCKTDYSNITELTIRDEANTYTKKFTELLSPYYLNL